MGISQELSSRLAHRAWPTGGTAVLAAAVGILVLAPAADAQSPCMPWEIYRPSLRMCEAKADTSAQPAVHSKVVVRKRGGTPPSLQEQARPAVVVREHSVEKPARPKVALRERVKEVGRQKEVVRERHSEPMSNIPLPEPKAQGSLNPLPGWKPDW